MIGNAVRPWTLRGWVPAVVACLGTCLAGCLQDPQVQLRPQPVVLETSPADAATLVATTTEITARFSTALDERTVDATTFLLMDGATGIPGTVTSSAATATFIPSTKLSPLRSYTAILKADIKGADGLRLPTDHVWTFRTRDGAWSAATTLESGSGAISGFPRVVVDPAGNAFVVWSQLTGGAIPVFSSRYADGGWSSALEIGMGGKPEIVVDDSGSAVAIWSASGGLGSNRFTPGAGWGTATLAVSVSVGEARISMDEPSGDAIVLIHKSGNGDLVASRYSSVSGWATATLIQPGLLDTNSELDVALAPSGKAVAVWPNPNDIFASIFTAGWSTPAAIESLSGNARSPQVVLGADGNGFAVWSQLDGGRTRIRASRYLPATGFATAGDIDLDAGNAREPRIAVDSMGGATAVWSQYYSNYDRTFSNRYVLGSGWGIAAPIDAGVGNSFDSRIAVAPDGRAVAVWRQFDGIQYDLWGSAYSLATGWGPPTLVSTGIGDASSPEIALDDSAKATAVWLESDGVRTNLWASRFVFE